MKPKGINLKVISNFHLVFIIAGLEAQELLDANKKLCMLLSLLTPCTICNIIAGTSHLKHIKGRLTSLTTSEWFIATKNIYLNR